MFDLFEHLLGHHLEMSPKCFTMATTELSSLRLRSGRMRLWMSECSFTQHVLNWLLHGIVTSLISKVYLVVW